MTPQRKQGPAASFPSRATPTAPGRLPTPTSPNAGSAGRGRPSDLRSRSRFRSLLYTPADRPERYQKAWKEGLADIVCADLEDAVAPEKKAAARKAVVAALKAVPTASCLRAVRINPAGTREHDADLRAVLAQGPDLIIVPKVESADDLTRLQARVEQEAAGPTRIIAILETARGIVAAREICAAVPLAAVCFGAEDLAADAAIRKGPDSKEVEMARQWVVLCAAAAGVPALDMITADYKDLGRTASDAKAARNLGYRGKMCVHPDQVRVVHEAFKPTKEERAWAQKVMDAVGRAGVAKGGVVSVDGKMVDVPVIEQARGILAEAESG